MPRPKKVTLAENLEETITELVDEVALVEKQSEENPPEQILIPFYITHIIPTFVVFFPITISFYIMFWNMG